MTTQANSIWKIAESMRQEIGLFDVSTLIKQCIEAGISVGVDDLRTIIQGPGRGGEFYIPADLTEFIAKLLEIVSPKTILDPWAGMGLLTIPLNKHFSPKVFRAISRNTAACEVMQMVDGSSGLSIDCVDPIRALAESDEQYDAVVTIPPFGMRSNAPLSVRVNSKEQEVRDDYGNLLILQSCLRLNEEGIGVFVVSNNFFFQSGKKGKARFVLESLGYEVTAAIELPVGTFHPLTSIATHIVIVQKSRKSDLFTAKFSPDEKHQRQLIRNLKLRKSGKVLSLGRVVSREEFRGFTAVEFVERVQKQARRMGLVPYAFSTVAKELHAPASASKHIRFPERANAIYLPQMAATDATTSQEKLPERLKSYYQIVLDAEIADAEYVAGLLNTQFGQLWRDSLRTGTTIPRIGKSLLEQSVMYLPPKGTQNIQQAVVDCQHKISDLQNELNEIEESLWNDPDSIEKAATMLERLTQEERFEDWIDTLPFPLASILWVCHTQKGSYEERYRKKIHFFEALSEFLAIVYLSVFTGSASYWPRLKEKFGELLANQHLSFDMATFGTWKCVVEFLSAETRKLFREDTELCFELFKTRNRTFIDAISEKRLLSIIQATNAIRNKWLGHTGAISESDAKAISDNLDAHILSVRQIFGLQWRNYELLMPLDCKIKDGIYCYKSTRVMGSRMPFPSENIELTEAMEDGYLHLKSPDEQRAVKLLPLVKLMPSPRTEQNACYFYNRQDKNGIRFLSYYFDSDSEVVDEFADVADALRKIT